MIASARGQPLLLAVSGGLDSMVLLDVAAASLRERIVVATFDHATGRAAAHAAAHVRARCAALGIECVSGRAEEAARSEAGLRAVRWAFLRQAAAKRRAVIATAHTRDDQVETVLMRVLRGAGARGLAGLYAASPVLRPLIHCTRRDVAAYARQRGLRWVDDPSNTSRRFLRNRIRLDLLPALRRVCPEIDAELLDVARRAAALRGEVERLARSLAPHAAAGRLDVAAGPFADLGERERRLVWPALAALAGVRLDARGIARLAEFSAGARIGSKVQISGSFEVTRSRDAYQLRESGQHAPAAASVGGTERVVWGQWAFAPTPAPSAGPAETTGKLGCSTMTGSWHGDRWSVVLAGAEAATVRCWQPGDRMVVRHGAPARKVKGLLSSARVTGHERAGWPVVLVDGEIVWIPGVVVGPRARGQGRPGLALACEQLNR